MRHGRKSRSVLSGGYKRHVLRDLDTGLVTAAGITPANALAKDQFSIDFAAGQLTCPAGVSMPFRPGRTVRFPKDTCAACPLRERCTASRPRTGGQNCAKSSPASPMTATVNWQPNDYRPTF